MLALAWYATWFTYVDFTFTITGMVQIPNVSYDWSMAFKGKHRPNIVHIGYQSIRELQVLTVYFPSFCHWQLGQSDLSGFGVHGNGLISVIPDNAYSSHEGDSRFSNPHEEYGYFLKNNDALQSFWSYKPPINFREILLATLSHVVQNPRFCRYLSRQLKSFNKSYYFTWKKHKLS